jgi:hypothetical protein
LTCYSLTEAYDCQILPFLRRMTNLNTYVPRLHTLEIQYEKLVIVTNNFTNDATRHNCSQLKQLIFNELVDYKQHFYLYFPFLLNNFVKNIH